MVLNINFIKYKYIMDIQADRFKFIKFERSHLPNKKYNGIIEDKITKRRQKVPFGSRSHMQYKDTTGLKLYSRLDHLDPKRKANYLARHEKTRHKVFSPSWFSWKFLWN